MSREYVCKNCGYSGKPKKQFWAWLIIGWLWLVWFSDEDRERIDLKIDQAYGVSRNTKEMFHAL